MRKWGWLATTALVAAAVPVQAGTVNVTESWDLGGATISGHTDTKWLIGNAGTTITVSNGTFRNNTLNDGGLFKIGGAVILDSVSFVNNAITVVGGGGTGGGEALSGQQAPIMFDGGSLTIIDCTIAGNTTPGAIDGIVSGDFSTPADFRPVTLQARPGNTTTITGRITNWDRMDDDGGGLGTVTVGDPNGVNTGTVVLSNIDVADINVVNGTLDAAGTVTAAVAVQSGGTLKGTGTVVGSVGAQSGGTVAPGNSIGTLTVTGGVTFDAGSVYQVEADSAGQADRIAATGAATLNGGTVQMVAGSGSYAAGTTYTILTAGGGVTGTFAGVTSNLAFLTPSLSYDATTVTLTLVRGSTAFTDFAASGGGPATTGAALDRASADPARSADMDSVVNTLTGLSAAQAQTALRSMSGETAMAASSATQAGTTRAMGVVAGRTAALRSGAAPGGGQSSLAPAAWMGLVQGDTSVAADSARAQRRSISGPLLTDTRAAELDGPAVMAVGNGSIWGGGSRWGAWTRGFGLLSDHDGDTDATDYRHTQAGFLAGVDYRVTDTLVLGVSGGFGRGWIDYDTVADEADIRSTYLGLYGGWSDGGWYLDGQVNLALHRNETSRDIILGATTRTATAEFDSREISAYAEAGRSLALRGGWTATPFVSADVRRSRQESYEETGAGAAGLAVDSATATGWRAGLGTLVGTQAATGDGTTLAPYVQARWLRAFGDRSTATDARFTGSPASTFALAGEEASRSAAILGAGLNVETAAGTTLHAAYDLTVDGNDTGHGITAGVKWRF